MPQRHSSDRVQKIKNYMKTVFSFLENAAAIEVLVNAAFTSTAGCRQNKLGECNKFINQTFLLSGLKPA